MKTQLQHYYTEQKKIADTNKTFLFLIKEGMTRLELKKLIEKRPATWARYKNWLPKLT
jgi:hypothetical protein